jgi:uncharacterized cupredoxin-like copper-binding protein
MSATLEPSTRDGTHSQSDADFDEALRKLQSEEEQLETRTRRLELSGPLAVTLSVIAFALALGALIVALTKDNGGATTTVAAAASTPGSAAQGASTAPGATMKHVAGMSNGMMMGAGGHGSFTKAQVEAANKGTVFVQLGDFWVAPTVTSIKAGKVTFMAKNIGMAPHELMIERAPIKLNAPGKPDEMAAQGMIDDMKTGQTGHMTLNLKPGNYVLFCNVSGHYAAGQHIAFTVTAH